MGLDEIIVTEASPANRGQVYLLLNLIHHFQSPYRTVIDTDTALETDEGAGVGMVLYAAIGTDINTDTTGSTLLRIDPDRSIHFGDCSFRAGLQTGAFLALYADTHHRFSIGKPVNLQSAFFGIIYLEEGKPADYLAGLTTRADITLVD